MIYEKEITYLEVSEDESLKDFLKKISADQINKTEFILNGEKWFIDFHPFDHSNDIIVEESIADKYDKFLLVKSGSNKLKIVGWTDLKTLKSVPARDIYRIGKKHYVVIDVNVKDLSCFKILRKDIVLKSNFIINQQEAENLGRSEMISSILAGVHFFAKQAGLYFKDINQKDEFILENKKIKIFVRDYLSDEDMLIPEEYFLSHPEIDFYVLCKIKGEKYNYLGYIEKEIIKDTRVVQMTGNIEMDSIGDKIRRIFAEQYKPLSDLIKIYEEIKFEEKKIEQQNYIPLHVHSEWSIGDGFGTVKYLAKILKEKGFKGCALTDHGTLAGVWEFQKACLLEEIKPIIGSEFYMNLEDLDGRFHITVLVKNQAGWKNILKLQSIATREGFYYKPVIKFSEILEYHDGLIILSGCSNGIISKLIEKEEFEKADEIIIKIKEIFQDDFYFEIMPQTIQINQEIMEMLYILSLKHKIKCVITTDSHYPKKEDKKFHDAVKAIALKKKYSEAGFGDDCFYLMQDKDLEERINDKCTWMKDFYKEFMKNTFEIFEKCNFKVESDKERDTLPRFCLVNNPERYYEREIKENFLKWKEKIDIGEEQLFLTNAQREEDE
jgi:DNA polymerase-3 subunit alpha